VAIGKRFSQHTFEEKEEVPMIHRVADLVAFEHFFERGRENHPRHRFHLQAIERG
jgi:hypothetical protein